MYIHKKLNLENYIGFTKRARNPDQHLLNACLWSIFFVQILMDWIIGILQAEDKNKLSFSDILYSLKSLQSLNQVFPLGMFCLFLGGCAEKGELWHESASNVFQQHQMKRVQPIQQKSR